MDKTYAPQHIESSWYQIWEAAGYFKPQDHETPYCIVLPPPNVTGRLHMGHGFQHTIMDTLIRYQRMQGRKTLWQPGTDHAGISTQLVVENRLSQQGILRRELTREVFLDKVWEWKTAFGNQITQQMKEIGASADWSRERFTLDEPLSFAVQKVFIQLYEEGLIYRGTRLVNWDPQLGTAVSDLEVVAEEEDGWLWHIQYSLTNHPETGVVVATTRPETLFGDMAVAVHPDDLRYQALIGQSVHLPLCDRSIPIVGDASIDPAFGTGCVKITPAHDFNDYALAKRHGLTPLTILTKKGTLNKEVPTTYQGMSTLKAREHVIEDLTRLGVLIKTEKHRLVVPRGEKSNAIIEPLLTDQWYVKMEPLAAPAIEAVKTGEIRFIPENWSKTYFQWMENIEDWCISRQLWWGHRIPAWYDNQGRIYVGYSEEDVRFKYNLSESIPLHQDEDVLDTWFSSALWPFSALGWPEKTPDFKTFYPTQVLVTGFDIIFFWVARMIMMGLKFTKQVPFTEVFMTGLIRDSHGHKMSKSKGNVLDPIDLIHGISLPDLIKKRTADLLLPSKINSITQQTEKEFPKGIPAYGADPLRFTYCSLANFGRDVKFDLQRVEGYRYFCNKLWNAARFVSLYVTESSIDRGDEALQYAPADLWIRSCLQDLIHACHEHFQSYRFDRLAHVLYDFTWHFYCDWYIEFSKIVLQDTHARPAVRRGTIATLLEVLDTLLHLLHPLMPFITEEIHAQLMKSSGLDADALMVSPYPTVQDSWKHPELNQDFDWLRDMIQAIRTIRSEMGISPSSPVPLILRHLSASQQEKVIEYQQCFIQLGKLTGISILNDTEPTPIAASAVVGLVEVLIPMAGLLDKPTELARLDRELKKLEKDILFLSEKLSKPHFTAKAPAAIIAKEQEKLAQSISARDKLSLQKERIEQL